MEQDNIADVRRASAGICKAIEIALGKEINTSKDFNFLRKRIYARLHIYVSRTTLMRVWGYVDEQVVPRRGTLDILSRFLGYNNWEEYLCNASLPKEQQSSPVMSRRLSVQNELSVRDGLRLTWQPERVCTLEYLGDLNFRVLFSKNTRLQSGDTFQCSLIIEGEPLYLDNLIQENRPPIAYVCGKKSGVRFESVELAPSLDV